MWEPWFVTPGMIPFTIAPDGTAEVDRFFFLPVIEWVGQAKLGRARGRENKDKYVYYL